MPADCTVDIQHYLRHTGEFIMTTGLPMIPYTLSRWLLPSVYCVVFALGLFGFFYQTSRILLKGAIEGDDLFSVPNPVIIHAAIVQNILSLFILIPGDGIVIWRAYAVWTRSKKVIMIPLLFLLGRLVNLPFFISCSIKHSDGLSHPFGPTACFATTASAWILSFLANISAILMIFYTAWRYHRSQKTLRRSGVTQPQFSPVARIMRLLVESGFAYFLVMIFSITITLWPTSTYGPGVVFTRTLASITTHCIGMVPTLTILLVTLYGSFDAGSLMVRSQPIHLTTNPRSTESLYVSATADPLQNGGEKEMGSFSPQILFGNLPI
ncbi:hypothetical protein C8J56DRAFT_1092721 [Mycena floridula]|nr:hypothetical protein C8J56DRAFT_1092721 [Mycena floridula]